MSCNYYVHGDIHLGKSYISSGGESCVNCNPQLWGKWKYSNKICPDCGSTGKGRKASQTFIYAIAPEEIKNLPIVTLVEDEYGVKMSIIDWWRMVEDMESDLDSIGREFS